MLHFTSSSGVLIRCGGLVKAGQTHMLKLSQQLKLGRYWLSCQEEWKKVFTNWCNRSNFWGVEMLREKILALLELEAVQNGRSVKSICKAAGVHWNSVYRLFKRTTPALQTVDKLLNELGWELKLVEKKDNATRTES
jgi:DNA-binding phage protein